MLYDYNICMCTVYLGDTVYNIILDCNRLGRDIIQCKRRGCINILVDRCKIETSKPNYSPFYRAQESV